MAFFLVRLSGVPAGRALFVVVGGIRCLAVVLLLSVAGGFCADVAVCLTGPVASTVGVAPGGSCPAHETSGNECVVLSVRCLWFRKRRFVVRVSRVGAWLPAFSAAVVSSIQHCSPHTMASWRLRGKMGVGCRQLACQTRLHLVHSVSVPPSSHVSHWSFLSPSQCSVGACKRQSLAMMCPVGVSAMALTLSFPCRRWLVLPLVVSWSVVFAVL